MRHIHRLSANDGDRNERHSDYLEVFLQEDAGKMIKRWCGIVKFADCT